MWNIRNDIKKFDLMYSHIRTARLLRINSFFYFPSKQEKSKKREKMKEKDKQAERIQNKRQIYFKAIN